MNKIGWKEKYSGKNQLGGKTGEGLHKVRKQPPEGIGCFKLFYYKRMFSRPLDKEHDGISVQ